MAADWAERAAERWEVAEETAAVVGLEAGCWGAGWAEEAAASWVVGVEPVAHPRGFQEGFAEEEAMEETEVEGLEAAARAAEADWVGEAVAAALPARAVADWVEEETAEGTGS